VPSILLLSAACGGSTLDAPLPPPDSTEPTFTPGVDSLVWSENFDRYQQGAAGVNALPTYSAPRFGFGTDVSGQPLIGPDGIARYDIVTGRGGAGNAALVHLFNSSFGAGGQQTARIRWPEPPGSVPKVPASATWAMSFWFRMTTATNGQPPTLQPSGSKWIEWWPPSGDRTQIGPYVNGGNKDYLGNVVGLKFHVHPASRGEVAYQPVHPYLTDVNEGNWHRFTILYKANTTNNWPNPSSRDGFVRAWIDGHKILDLSAAAAGITPPQGTKVWCTLTEVDEISSWDTTHFMWPDIINGTTYGFDLLYDDLTWWVKH